MEAEGITITPKQREEVDRQLQRTALTRRVRERLEMVKAAALGDERRRIARWSGRSVVTVERWLGRFAQGGVDALADALWPMRPVGSTGARRCGVSGGHGNGVGTAAQAGPSR